MKQYYIRILALHFEYGGATVSLYARRNNVLFKHIIHIRTNLVLQRAAFKKRAFKKKHGPCTRAFQRTIKRPSARAYTYTLLLQPPTYTHCARLSLFSHFLLSEFHICSAALYLHCCVPFSLSLSLRYSIIGRMPGKKPGNEVGRLLCERTRARATCK